MYQSDDFVPFKFSCSRKYSHISRVNSNSQQAIVCIVSSRFSDITVGIRALPNIVTAIPWKGQKYSSLSRD